MRLVPQYFGVADDALPVLDGDMERFGRNAEELLSDRVLNVVPSSGDELDFTSLPLVSKLLRIDSRRDRMDRELAP